MITGRAVRLAVIVVAPLALIMLVVGTWVTHDRLVRACTDRQARMAAGADPITIRIVGVDRPQIDLRRFLDDGAVDIGCELKPGTGGTELMPSSYALIALSHYLVGMTYGSIGFVIRFAFEVLPRMVGWRV